MTRRGSTTSSIKRLSCQRKGTTSAPFSLFEVGSIVSPSVSHYIRTIADFLVLEQDDRNARKERLRPKTKAQETDPAGRPKATPLADAYAAKFCLRRSALDEAADLVKALTTQMRMSGMCELTSSTLGPDWCSRARSYMERS